MANEKLTLEILTQATGQDSVDRMTSAMNRFAAASETAANKTTQSSKVAAAAVDEHALAWGKLGRGVKDAFEGRSAYAAVESGYFLQSLTGSALAAGAASAGFLAIAGSSLAATRSLATLAEQTQAVSLKTGLTTREVGQFGFAAKATGSDIGAFETAMRKLSAGLVEGGTDGKKAADALSDLGIKSRSTTGEIRPMGEIFEQIGSRLAGIESPAKRAKLAVDLFGRSGIELIPTLVSLNQHLDKAKELGLGLSDAELDKFKAYKERLDEIDAKWEVLGRKFKEGIAGTITVSLLTFVADTLGGKGPLGSPNAQRDAYYGMVGMGAGAVIGAFAGGVGSVPGAAIGGAAGVAASQISRGLFGDKPVAPLIDNGIPGSGSSGFVGTALDEQAGSAAAARFQAARNRSAEGMTARITELEDKNKNISSTLQPGSGIGGDAANSARAEYAANQAQITSLKESLKSLNEEEAKYQATLTKMRELREAGTPFYVIDPGRKQSISSSQDLANELKRGKRSVPSLLRGGETAEDQTGPFANTFGQLSPGMQYVGGGEAFVPNSDEMSKASRAVTVAFEAGTKAFTEKWNAGTVKLDNSQIGTARDVSERQARIAGIGAMPGDELSVASKQLAIRMSALSTEKAILDNHKDLYDMDVENARLDKQSQDANLEYYAAVQEYQAKQKEGFRNLAGGAFDSLLNNSFSSFLKSQAMNLGRTVTENAAGMAWGSVKDMIPHASGKMGDLLKGTPFGPDPLKTATDLNTAATIANTQALSLSKTGGGGGLPGSFGSGSTSNPFVFSAADSGSGGGLSDIGDGLPMSSGAYGATAASNSMGKVSMGSSSLGKNLGLGAAAAGGAFAAFSDFRSGGAKNDIAGVGTGLGSAAAVAAMIPGGQVVALGLGIASAATSLIAGLLPDPKKVREASINKAIEQGTYHAPTALNVSQDTSGNFTDFDAHGMVRSSSFRAVPQVTDPYTWWKGNTPYQVPGNVTSPYSTSQPAAPTTIIIQAADAQSFNDMANRNKAGLSDAIASHLQNGDSRLHGAIRSVAGS